MIPRMCRGTVVERNVRQTRESRSDLVIAYGLKKTFWRELEVIEGRGNIVPKAGVTRQREWGQRGIRAMLDWLRAVCGDAKASGELVDD